MNEVKNVESLVKQAIQNNDIDSQSELATNPSAYACCIVIGANKGQSYALFYKKSNCWVAEALNCAVKYIHIIRAKCGDSHAAMMLDMIENQIFNQDLNDGYELVELGVMDAFDLRVNNLPMFYCL